MLHKISISVKILKNFDYSHNVRNISILFEFSKLLKKMSIFAKIFENI